MATVIIPSVLRTYTDRASQVTAPGSTVAEVVAALAAAYPDLAPHILDDQGALRGFVNVFIGETDIRTLDGIETAVDDDTSLTLLPAIAGGSPAAAVRAGEEAR